MIEFVRRLVTGATEPCGNRVQLEDATGTPYDAADPLPIGVVVPTAPYHGVVTVASCWTLTTTCRASPA